MSVPIHRRDNCRLCGGKNLELALQLAPTPVGADYVTEQRLQEIQESYPIDLYMCLDCSYVGIVDVVDPQVMFEDSAELTSMSLGVVEDLQNLAETTVRRLGVPQNSLIVDIGSNDGTLLKAFKNLGMRVLGVEPAKFAADASVEAGIPTLQTYFGVESAKSIKDKWGSADVITANRVLANIDDMENLIQGVKTLLDPKGALVFETGYLVDIVDKNLFDTIYHEHLGYDTVRAFDNYFRIHGMELVEVERIPLKGGSLRGIAQFAGGPRPLTDSVASLIKFEQDIGIGNPNYFKGLSNRLEQTQSELLDILSRFKSEGKTVAGYGASVGSTTVIYYFGLADTLAFLADDDPRNQNLFSPGAHIPVHASDALYEKKPDYVLILAWRYADPIIKRHQRFLDEGGHFIVPFPEIKII